MSYHFAGAISTFFFLLTVYGLWLQLKTILNRKEHTDAQQGYSSAVLSLNRFNSSYLAYFAFIIIGLFSDPINHYLVWPRLLASILVVAILFEIARDRRDAPSKISLSACAGSLCLVMWWCFVTPPITSISILLTQCISVSVAAFLVQSYISQIRMMRLSQSIGAIDIRTHKLLLLKDVSTFFLGLSMGFESGWPVMMLSGVSVANQVALLIQFQILVGRSIH